MAVIIAFSQSSNAVANCLELYTMKIELQRVNCYAVKTNLRRLESDGNFAA